MFCKSNLFFVRKLPPLNFTQCRALQKTAEYKKTKVFLEDKKTLTITPALDDNLSLHTNYRIENELNNPKYKYDENKIYDEKESLQKSPKFVTSAFNKFAPTYNLSAYLNKSETLQQLYKLGVDFSSIEKRKGLGDFIIKLDFDKNIKSHLIFLNDIGIIPDAFGEIITKNPLIFKPDLDDLKIRINYLQSKNFEPLQIQRICTKNPFWLMFSTKRIDKRLGYFQKEFKLSGDDIRFLVTKQPKLITYHMATVQKNTFCIREEMGFDKDEIKCLLLSKPKLWMLNDHELIERFDYVHNKMNISHDLILQSPDILTSRQYRVRQRHEYLKFLGIAQYDPKKDLYVSLKTLVEGNDEHFVKNVAKTDITLYDMFLKTL